MLNGPRKTIRQARRLRREMSLPEVLLWRVLQEQPDGIKFRRQHPAGPYTLDFYCTGALLAIEVDSEAHERGDRPERDAVRDLWLAERGVLTVRIRAADVLSDLNAVVRHVVDEARSRRPLHQPSTGPPPRSGEE
jgi:very-short-patch-repair endonuclease